MLGSNSTMFVPVQCSQILFLYSTKFLNFKTYETSNQGNCYLTSYTTEI